MTQEMQTREAAHGEFSDRLAHFGKVAQGIESLKRGSQAASLQVMCGACKGAGGWGCGEDAEHCTDCDGVGEVPLGAQVKRPTVKSAPDIAAARRFIAKLPEAIDVDLRECAEHLKDALDLIDLQSNSSPASWESMYFDQCAATDDLRAKLEAGSDKALLARIAELEADLATMNARYSTLQVKEAGK